VIANAEKELAPKAKVTNSFFMNIYFMVFAKIRIKA
jgi:hypothetical protein